MAGVGSWSHSRSPPAPLAQAPQEPGLEAVFLGSGGRWNDCHCGRAFWRDAGAHDVERAQKRFMPASTFKVPHALFALDAGAVVTSSGDSVGWRETGL